MTQIPTPHRVLQSIMRLARTGAQQGAASTSSSGCTPATRRVLVRASAAAPHAASCSSQHQHAEPAAAHGSTRRGILAAYMAAASLAALPADASVTVAIKSRTTMTPYTTKAGYQLSIPSSWVVAYDRGGEEPGTQVCAHARVRVG